MAGTRPTPSDHPTAAQTLLAWLVHMFTASGAILALLALLAVEDGEWGLALMWLLVALVVDGVDGSLARWARVSERAARVDGDTLDLVIDYLTYVFVPTLFMWRAGLIPEALAPWLAAGILLSSLYLFARTDMKTEDGYFRGFPALWNLVAFYLFVLQPGPGDRRAGRRAVHRHDLRAGSFRPPVQGARLRYLAAAADRAMGDLDLRLAVAGRAAAGEARPDDHLGRRRRAAVRPRAPAQFRRGQPPIYRPSGDAGPAPIASAFSAAAAGAAAGT